MSFNTIIFFLIITLTFSSCGDDDSDDSTTTTSAVDDYTGTASVTQGAASVTTASLYSCTDGRDSPIGTITSDDGAEWIVPASVNFTNSSFPTASDLYNPCNGNEYSSALEALLVLDGSDVIEIDPDGEIITAFVFADNYFEMYIDGIAVGKDNVPFTQFNSNIVRFKANRPFTIAMKLVDWEENSGLGSEEAQGFSYIPGDGGMVAVFKDENDNIIATTGSDWNAQTYYISPVKDLSCPTESGSVRNTSSCDTEASDDGTSYFALHWETPSDWFDTSYDDSEWPSASTYSNTTIGVDNKPGYTNFTDIFDDSSNDADFIWTSNIILDNHVLTRYTVE